MEADDITSRVEELESQLAFLDELHGRLNDVVARQDREIVQLRAELRELAGKLVELGEAMPDSDTAPADDAPPHY